MRYIQLDYHDFELFDTNIGEASFSFYSTHQDGFKQMWREQGKDFWIRFILTFRSFSAHYGFIGLMSSKAQHFNEFVDWFFIKIHEVVVDGSFSDIRQLLEDVALAIDRRSLIKNIRAKSCAKDPFFFKETRDAYRRLFGNPSDKNSYVRVLVIFPLYEVFTGSLCVCLNRWVRAPLMNPTDTTYWKPPPPAPTPKTAELPSTKYKKSTSHSKKKSAKSTELSGKSDVVRSRPKLADVEALLTKERAEGKPTGPMFVTGWPVSRDPRFYDPVNPLYDPAARRDVDWRDDLDLDIFEKFVRFVNKVYCETETDRQPNKKPETYEMETENCSDNHVATEIGASCGGLLRKGADLVDGNLMRVASESSVEKSASKNGRIVQKNGVELVDELFSADVTVTRETDDVEDANSERKVAEERTGECFTEQDVGVCETREDQDNGSIAAEEIVTGGIDATWARGKVSEEKDSGDGNVLRGGMSVDYSTRSEQEDDVKNLDRNADELDKLTDVVATGKVDDAGLDTNLAGPSGEIRSKIVEGILAGLRLCAGCSKQELVAHEFKKCKKCKELGVKEARYYCSRACQVSDWNERHRREHREQQLQ